MKGQATNGIPMHFVRELRVGASPAHKATSVTYPLSLQQLHRWQKGEWIRTHNIGFAYRLTGELQIPLLRSAVGMVCRRHEALLTRIVEVDGVPGQLVGDAPSDLMNELLVQVGDKSATIEQSFHEARAFFEKPFDLAGALLFRCGLMHLGDRDHLFVLAMNHMIADGFSFRIIVSELGRCYDDLKHNRQLSLRQVPMQYGDYASAQRRLQGHWQEIHGPYWHRRLMNARRVHLPIDCEIKHVPPNSVAEMRVELGDAISTGLRLLARQHRTTLARIVLALYVAWLSVLSDARDFVVPYTTIGRRVNELGTIGFFAHVLYLRMEIEPEDAFADILTIVDAELTTASEHMDFGQAAFLRPDLGAGTRFQWEVGAVDAQSTQESATQNLSGSRLAAIPLRISSGIPENSMCTIEMLLRFAEGASGIIGYGTYRADLFSGTTINRFIDVMRVLAAEVIWRPTVRIADMRLSVGVGQE